ncbi:MAG: hypothetical protein ACYCU0_06475 [Solirubrobacteraceae bacterium]
MSVSEHGAEQLARRESAEQVERRPRSRILGGCVAAAELIVLALVFVALGLHGGLWALPAFAPLLGWMLACGASGHALRPGALTRLAGGGRVAATAFALAVFLPLWSSWSGPALAAWHRHQGGLSVGGHGGAASVPSLSGFPTGGGGVALPSLPDPFPRFPYASVVSASPATFAVVCVTLVALGMVAMPGRGRRTVAMRGRGSGMAAMRGRRRADAPAGEDVVDATGIVAPHVELASARQER